MNNENKTHKPLNKALRAPILAIKIIKILFCSLLPLRNSGVAITDDKSPVTTPKSPRRQISLSHLPGLVINLESPRYAIAAKEADRSARIITFRVGSFAFESWLGIVIKIPLSPPNDNNPVLVGILLNHRF